MAPMTNAQSTATRRFIRDDEFPAHRYWVRNISHTALDDESRFDVVDIQEHDGTDYLLAVELRTGSLVAVAV